MITYLFLHVYTARYGCRKLSVCLSVSDVKNLGHARFVNFITSTVGIITRIISLSSPPTFAVQFEGNASEVCLEQGWFSKSSGQSISRSSAARWESSVELLRRQRHRHRQSIQRHRPLKKFQFSDYIQLHISDRGDLRVLGILMLISTVNSL